MLKTFDIQIFFGYNPLLGSYLAHIKKYFDSFIVYYAKQPTFGEQNIPFLRVKLYWDGIKLHFMYCRNKGAKPLAGRKVHSVHSTTPLILSNRKSSLAV